MVMKVLVLEELLTFMEIMKHKVVMQFQEVTVL